MFHTTPYAASAITRRTAVTGLGVGALGLALAASTRHAAAQEATPVGGNLQAAIDSGRASPPSGATIESIIARRRG